MESNELQQDLLTEKGREKAIESLNKGCLEALKIIGVELSPNAICEVFSDNVIVKVQSKNSQIQSSSMASIHSKIDNHDLHWLNRGNSINVGTSGGFTPSDEGCYWRTIHAASILKNWSSVCEVVNKYCAMYQELYAQIRDVNGKYHI
jgi:hypothetical protein